MIDAHFLSTHIPLFRGLPPLQLLKIANEVEVRNIAPGLNFSLGFLRLPTQWFCCREKSVESCRASWFLSFFVGRLDFTPPQHYRRSATLGIRNLPRSHHHYDALYSYSEFSADEYATGCKPNANYGCGKFAPSFLLNEYATA